LNIDDESDGEIDYDKYEVNVDSESKKKKYKRVYDSKYKLPLAKKLRDLSSLENTVSSINGFNNSNLLMARSARL
jgi:hypothetical protein